MTRSLTSTFLLLSLSLATPALADELLQERDVARIFSSIKTSAVSHAEQAGWSKSDIDELRSQRFELADEPYITHVYISETRGSSGGHMTTGTLKLIDKEIREDLQDRPEKEQYHAALRSLGLMIAREMAGHLEIHNGDKRERYQSKLAIEYYEGSFLPGLGPLQRNEADLAVKVLQRGRLDLLNPDIEILFLKTRHAWRKAKVLARHGTKSAQAKRYVKALGEKKGIINIFHDE